MVHQYNLAQLYLSQYKKLEPKDPEVDFILGLILFDKWDYETSNIYFNHAVLGGYKPKIVVERKLAYNYWLLEKPKNMLQVLWYLVLNDDVTELDITNAIYLALKSDGARNAQEWIKIGLEKFPNSIDMLALQAWYFRITDNKTQAQSIVDEVLKKNSNNLVGLVQAGILAFDAGSTQKSFGYFQKAKIIDAGGNWWETIDDYIAKIKNTH
jgi:tetratricopeptide (TPR) repeat protein